jgi:hypothetical protein
MDMAMRGTVEHSSPYERLTLAGGIGFAAVQFAALAYGIPAILAKRPGLDAPAAEQVASIAQHGTAQVLGNYLLALPVPFFLLFLGGLYGILRRADPGGGLAMAAAGSGVAMALIWPFGLMLTNISVAIARDGGDVATAWALDAVAPFSRALSGLPCAVLLLATALLLPRTGRAPRWLARTGHGLAAISLIGSGTLVVGGLFPIMSLGTLLFEIWICALSIALLRSARPAAGPAPRAIPA